MASYNGKDIDRVSRLGGMSRARAEALLQQYDGHADRVLEEKCGAVRVYVEPERVAAQENVLPEGRNMSLTTLSVILLTPVIPMLPSTQIPLPPL